jgi:ubiquinone/menaquinone biosynthesis C-methylase UbiE
VGLWEFYKRRITGVPAEEYTRDYFLSDHCEGFYEFSSGRRVSHIKERLVGKVAPVAGDLLLDLGCGRGEVLWTCTQQGARAVGVDYSLEAVKLARETCGEAAPVLRADVSQLPFRAGVFTKVYLGDVIEHLTANQGLRTLDEAYRVLAPGGLLVLHTSPNVLFIRLVFPWILVGLLLTGRLGLLRMLLSQYRVIRKFHVREYSVGRLRRLFRSSRFPDAEVECDPDVLRGGKSRYTESLWASRYVRAMAGLLSRPPLVAVFSNDLWAVAKKAR